MTPSQLAAAPHRLGIAVDAKDPALRRAEQRLAVTAAAKRAVDIDRVITRGQCGEDGLEQNGDVLGRAPRLRYPGRRC